MIEYIGYLGMLLLLLNYIISLRTKTYFWKINTTASFILTVHAIILKDIPFFIVNGFIAVISGINIFKK